MCFGMKTTLDARNCHLILKILLKTKNLFRYFKFSTLQMLGSLENKMEDLFQQIEMLPSDVVEKVEKAKEKERRQRQRDEAIRLKKMHDEERRLRAQERAREPPRHHEGRRPVFRSKPPAHKRKQTEALDEAKLREEEEFAYFFT